MPHHDNFQTVKAVAKSYWCPFCLERSVAAVSTSGPHALRLFRSCSTHRHRYEQKRCPCGKPWADCLACMDKRVDPRAGAGFCPCCRLRYGASTAASTRLCACRPRQGAPVDDVEAFVSSVLN